MKKRTLKEELERIHQLTYGKNLILKEDSSTDIDLNVRPIKTNDPTKASDVSDSVSELYKNLENAANSGGLKQEQTGSITYKKEVESLQIGLYLLGYELPRYGIDGKFGPETAATITKFDIEYKLESNNPVNESASDLRMQLNKIGYKEKGNELTSGGEINDEISNIVDQILNDFHSKYPNVKVTITSGNDKFHSNLKYKSKHSEGLAVDLTLDPYTNETSDEFESVLNSFKSKNPSFNYVNEYKHPSGSATAGHFHLQSGTLTSSPEGNVGSKEMVTATPEMIRKMIELLKSKSVTSDQLDNVVNTYKVNDFIGISSDDFTKMINLIINKLEGGYYHPNMLADSRIKDTRYGNSGETMFGIDRKTGVESKSQAGLEFWDLIDAADAKDKWKPEYMGGELEPKLRDLVVKMIKPEYYEFFKRYLSPEAQKVVVTDPKLVFQFIYSTFNGEGWFREFAKYINQKVSEGVSDTTELNKGIQNMRINSKNSLIAQVGNKLDNILSGQV